MQKMRFPFREAAIRFRRAAEGLRTLRGGAGKTMVALRVRVQGGRVVRHGLFQEERSEVGILRIFGK